MCVFVSGCVRFVCAGRVDRNGAIRISIVCVHAFISKRAETGWGQNANDDGVCIYLVDCSQMCGLCGLCVCLFPRPLFTPSAEQFIKGCSSFRVGVACAHDFSHSRFP